MDDAKKDRLILTVVLTVGFFVMVGSLLVVCECKHGETVYREKNIEETARIEYPKNYIPQIGDTVIIKDNDMDVSFAGITDRDFDQFVKYMQAKDKAGCLELMDANRVYTIRNGVKAIYIATSSFGVRQIRVIGGKDMGRLGYVFSEAVKPVED